MRNWRIALSKCQRICCAAMQRNAHAATIHPSLCASGYAIVRWDAGINVTNDAIKMRANAAQESSSIYRVATNPNRNAIYRKKSIVRAFTAERLAASSSIVGIHAKPFAASAAASASMANASEDARDCSSAGTNAARFAANGASRARNGA